MLSHRTLHLTQRLAGFSLVELIVAIAVLAIVVAIAIPSFSAMIQNTRIRTATESIQNGIQIARAEAVKRNTLIRFELAANSSWQVKCVTQVADLDGDGEDECPAVIQERATGEGSAASIVTTTDPTVATTMVFNGFGRLESLAGGSTPPSQVNINVDIDPNVLPPEQSKNLRVVVGVGGTVRMCDPDPSIQSTDPRVC